jgi:hypothetical protein
MRVGAGCGGEKRPENEAGGMGRSKRKEADGEPSDPKSMREGGIDERPRVTGENAEEDEQVRHTQPPLLDETSRRQRSTRLRLAVSGSTSAAGGGPGAIGESLDCVG